MHRNARKGYFIYHIYFIAQKVLLDLKIGHFRFFYIYIDRLSWKWKEKIMSSSTTDKIKGRLKEAAGALTGDKDLKREWQRDQAAAKVKENMEKVVDKVKDLVGDRKKD